MNAMKNHLVQKLTRYVCLSAVAMITLLGSCSDDPEVTNEEEVITKITVTLTTAGGTPVLLSWTDTNLNSIVDPAEITASGSLLAGKAYTATIELLNESADPVINVSEEVKEEAEDHIFCFTATNVNLTFSGFDTDANGQPLGISSTWTTGTASTGTVTIKLWHQPGFKTGSCPLSGDPGIGETDVDIDFNVQIQSPV
jgi:hypothetical protein